MLSLYYLKDINKREVGEKVKKGKILRMPIVLHEALKKIADEKGLTMTGLILNVLWKFVENINKKGE